MNADGAGYDLDKISESKVKHIIQEVKKAYTNVRDLHERFLLKKLDLHRVSAPRNTIQENLHI